MNRETGTGKYEQLLAHCDGLAPVTTAVVHPCEASALAGVIDDGAKGLTVPIILTSRADSVRSRIASCGVAMLVVHARRTALQAVSA